MPHVSKRASRALLVRCARSIEVHGAQFKILIISSCRHIVKRDFIGINISFSSELNEGDDSLQELNTMNTPEENCAHAFSSKEFGRFLSKEFPSNLESLSKTLSVPSSDPNVFRSKDAFSNLFTSSDWGMKLQQEEVKVATAVVEVPAEKKKDDIFSSNEWMPMKTLGNHVDVPYSREMFDGSKSNEFEITGPPVELPQAKTDWNDLFFSQMQLLPPSQAAEEPAANLKPADDSVVDSEPVAPQKTPKKKTRVRKPRKKVVPDFKVYVQPAELDVLLGRGGKTNHHPGNKRYREEVENLRKWYSEAEENERKTELSQMLVEYINNYNGRFLEKDSEGWYEVPNTVARRKASQALREENDPERRKQKRARYLRKKAKREAAAPRR